MSEHRLERTQFVPRPIDEVFAFYADAQNLARITPPWLNFSVRGSSDGDASSPIRMRDRTFGAIYIDSSIANYTFTESAISVGADDTTIPVGTGGGGGDAPPHINPPRRPARPAICWNSFGIRRRRRCPSHLFNLPMMTERAGIFTPSASVSVAKTTCISPREKSTSTNCLSSGTTVTVLSYHACPSKA